MDTSKGWFLDTYLKRQPGTQPSAAIRDEYLPVSLQECNSLVAS